MNDLARYLLSKEYADKAVKAAVKSNRAESLDPGSTLEKNIIDTVGLPLYVSEEMMSEYEEYGIEEVGWYVFARIAAEDGVAVGAGFEVTGAAGYKEPEEGATSVDVAIKFGVTAESQVVTVNWGDTEEIFVFRATDLAIRNLDYRVTFYLYDISDYATWTYKLTTDTTFKSGTKYFTKDGDVYTPAEVTVGQSVTANTYYVHQSLTLQGFVRNISYSLDEVDCPVTIHLPEVADDLYGAWFELQTNFKAQYSVTLVAPTGARVSGNGVQTPKAGIDIINLMYHKPTKTWLPTVTNWAVPT